LLKGFDLKDEIIIEWGNRIRIRIKIKIKNEYNKHGINNGLVIIQTTSIPCCFKSGFLQLLHVSFNILHPAISIVRKVSLFKSIFTLDFL
jgi:hypothetical protein